MNEARDIFKVCQSVRELGTSVQSVLVITLALLHKARAALKQPNMEVESM